MLSRLVQFLPPRVRRFLRRIPVLVRLYQWLQRGQLMQDRNALIALITVTVVIGISAPTSQTWFSPSAVVLTVLAGGLMLRVRSLGILLGAVAAALLYDAIAMGFSRVGPGVIATIIVTAVLATVLARSREQLGVKGLRGEQMLLELRDRLRRHGEMPNLPPGWDSTVVLLQAGGSSFGGDFFVSVCNEQTLEVALVDVSGKGVDAGTRALMLSGAFGGLLGSLESERFLSACNAYLQRQRWDEGFVTAVHLTIDLESGEYTVESAGHPPAVQFNAGSGTWRVSSAKGVVLGVVPEMSSEPERGVLGPGDALLLYTDGLVEAPGRDLDAGIDRLLGAVESLVPSGFKEGATELVTEMAAARDDDCALVLIWRK
ncbi:PP2C family protein-serine/threonine phosphatase [Actinoallomurus sp. NPDC050550]|uniref:PP2C family protein-serine/threonine phosphatase n=1 Tax=Actinoallomurus sp. NPDC050550 TaxID=3154937 RepID=UPI003407A02F